MWTIFIKHRKEFENEWKEEGIRCENKYLCQLTEMLCKTPAKIMNILSQKGTIAVGKKADFVIWDPKASVYITEEMIHSRHKKNSLYIGHELQGRILATYLKGLIIYNEKGFQEKNGQVLLNSFIKK